MTEKNIEKTMDKWISEKVGLKEGQSLTRELLENFQFDKLKETLDYAKKNSRFYNEKFSDFNLNEIKELKDIEKLPFTTVENLKENGIKMLCVSQDEVSRIVTLDTSGTTDRPKRVYFTKEDQELTKDYFDRGMRNMVDERDNVLILLPYERPGSVGDLLAEGIYRLGAGVYKYGLLRPETESSNKNMNKLIKLIIDEKITFIVGMPTQVAKLALESEKTGLNKNLIRSVLLSAEYVSMENRESIARAWDCNIFEHYGMTEMGLGGALSCIAFNGCHPREVDLYFEIVNPETGKTVEEGHYGEVAVTTLTRKAMPFIRYKTGDISRWLIEECPCGSILKRLDRIGDRKIKKGEFISLY